jgi:hypothetical protein
MQNTKFSFSPVLTRKYFDKSLGGTAVARGCIQRSEAKRESLIGKEAFCSCGMEAKKGIVQSRYFNYYGAHELTPRNLFRQPK